MLWVFRNHKIVKVINGKSTCTDYKVRRSWLCQWKKNKGFVLDDRWIWICSCQEVFGMGRCPRVKIVWMTPAAWWEKSCVIFLHGFTRCGSEFQGIDDVFFDKEWHVILTHSSCTYFQILFLPSDQNQTSKNSQHRRSPKWPTGTLQAV